MTHGWIRLGIVAALTVCVKSIAAETNHGSDVQEVMVWGQSISRDDAAYVNPTSVLLPEDMQAINAATTEDLVKFEPSLVIRRRFIGDANGTMGVRGSNMFQTSRSMVFADGVPLHYFLQSRWNGAPRWTMVSASEIAKVEVLYGPFSALYSGNSMGGVVLIETALPTQREFHVNLTGFQQDFSAYGFSDQLPGYKGFVSLADVVGNFSYYLSYNHLQNDAQPQTFRNTNFTEATTADSAQGGLVAEDSVGATRFWYGDTGVVKTQTDNYKIKLGYDFGGWQALLNVALEDRTSTNTGNTYIHTLQGAPLWSGNAVTSNGVTFNFNSTGLNASELERQSLSVGLRVRGQLSDGLQLEANLNQFDILEDETHASARNPNDPAFDGSGSITDYPASGWQAAEVKLTWEDFLTRGLQFVSGARHENYSLNLDVYSSEDYAAGMRGGITSRFGGDTQLDALFAQWNWAITARFSVAAGLRYEHFASNDGYYSDDKVETPETDLVLVPNSSANKVSPKFSVGFKLSESWSMRYSLAQAYRFPIAEELFRQYQDYNSINLANPELKPEHGKHHNLMLDKVLSNGLVRINLFQETVRNAIESQNDPINNVNSFVPIDEVRVWGSELIVNQNDVWVEGLNLRLNLTYTDAEMTENRADPSIEGNVYPRMPKWRANLLTSYAINDRWSGSFNLQYAASSYGRLDNSDRTAQVYGAQDGYTRLGVKADYQMTKEFSLSLGVDNVNNDIDYVAHPWPGRTFYLTLALEF